MIFALFIMHGISIGHSKSFKGIPDSKISNRIDPSASPHRTGIQESDLNNTGFRSPTNLTTNILLHPYPRLSRPLPKHMPVKSIHLVRVPRELHSADVVWTRVGRGSVCAGLPYASGEIQSSLRIGYTIPVHEQLQGVDKQANSSESKSAYPSVFNGFLMRFTICFIQGCDSRR